MKDLLLFSWNERGLDLGEVQRDLTTQFRRTGIWALLWLLPFAVPAVAWLVYWKQPKDVLFPEKILPYLVFWALWFLGITLGRTVLFDALFRKALGRPLLLRDSIPICLRRGLPLMFTLPLNGLAAPWSVAAVSGVVEGLSVRPALKRSRELTDGSIRQIWDFAGRRALPLFSFLFMGALLENWTGTGLQVAGLLLSAAYRTHADVILYFHLRRLKEGLATIEEVAAKFD